MKKKNRKAMKLNQWEIRKYLVLFLCFLMLLPLFPSHAHAEGGRGTVATAVVTAAEEPKPYNSWVTGATVEDIYGHYNETSDFRVILDENGEAISPIEHLNPFFSPTAWLFNIISGVFIVLGIIINGLLGGRILPSMGWDQLVNVGHLDLTMDSVIFGRLLNGHPINYVSWELKNGNFYGIVSSFIYRFFGNIAFSAFVILFLWMLLGQLFTGGDSKKRAQMKDSIMHGALILLLLYLIPHLADICVYLRDWMLRGVYFAVSGDTNGSSISYVNIFSTYVLSSIFNNSFLSGFENEQIHNTAGGLGMGILFFAASCAGLIFAIDYIRIAIKQTALFGFFPVFAILSLKNKKLLANWLVEFIPNLFIPVIDCVLLMAPVLVIRIANTAGLVGLAGGVANETIFQTNELDIGVFLIVVIMIFSVIPMRKEILKLIGQANPMGGSRGFGGVMAAGMMAVRMMGRGGTGTGTGVMGGATAADNLAMANALDNYGTAGANASASLSASTGAFSSADGEAAMEGKMGEFISGNAEEGGANAFAQATTTFDGGEEFDRDDDINTFAQPDKFGDEIHPDDYRTDAEEGEIAPADSKMQPGAESSVEKAMEGMQGEDIPDTSETDRVSGDVYDRMAYEPSREKNLEDMERIEGKMRNTKSDIDTLSAENAYDESLITKYENLNSQIDAARSRSQIMDGVSGGMMQSSEESQLVKERNGVIDQMKQSAKGYKPKENIAGPGEALNNPDYRTERLGHAASEGDLVGQLKENIADRKSQIADNKKLYTAQKFSYDQAAAREASFARESQAYGGSGERFKTAGDYRRAKEINEVYKKAATYRNFDTKGISEHLDPATRAEFYRERAKKQMEAETRARRQKAATVAGVSAGALVGGSAMMFGGEQAAMNGAMMGGMAGGMFANKASSPAKAQQKEERSARAEQREIERKRSTERALEKKHPSTNDSGPKTPPRTKNGNHAPSPSKKTELEATRQKNKVEKKVSQDVTNTPNVPGGEAGIKRKESLSKYIDAGKNLTEEAKKDSSE